MKKTVKHQIDDHKKGELIKSAGISGYGVYWFLEEHLHTVRGNAIVYTDEGLIPLIERMGTTLKEVQKVIRVCLKQRLFYMEGMTVRTEALRREVSPEVSEKRKAAQAAGLKKRLEKKAILTGLEVPEPKAPPPPKQEAPAPIAEAAPVVPVAVEVKPEAPKKEPEKITKEWEFTILFNEIRKKHKPNARGLNALSANDKTNFKKLLEAGYTKPDFVAAVTEQMKSEYVMENGLDTPEHVLRVGNFQRYLSKATKKPSGGNFNNTETENPQLL